MWFGIEYNGGYIVTARMYDESMRMERWFPLRNFGDHQGDARIYKEVDLPSMSIEQIKMVAKSYNKGVKYKRINSKRFVREEIWKQE